MSEKARFTPQMLRQVRKDGSVKWRGLMVPSEEGMERHKAMLKLLYAVAVPMPHATGALPGMRLLDNVRPHMQNNWFYMADLKNAFPSIDRAELRNIARTPLIPKRHQPEVLDFIQMWATDVGTPGLPLGAPASPFLFNLYCAPMDQVLAKYCTPRHIAYTRYLDDLTFSADSRLGKTRRKAINSIVQDHPGMEINHSKSRVHSLNVGPVTVTGVSLYPDRRMAPSPLLYGAAHEVFETAAAMQAAGTPLSDEVLGRVHGFHGALHLLSSSETPVLRRMDRAYRQVVGSIALS